MIRFDFILFGFRFLDTSTLRIRFNGFLSRCKCIHDEDIVVGCNDRNDITFEE